jgi:hypothetical protein
MDELEISGRRYLSTRRAAREHGYHSDYMGQLIRGGKVAGQKVGRSWYIDEQSLAVYLGKAPTESAQEPELKKETPASVEYLAPVAEVDAQAPIVPIVKEEPENIHIPVEIAPAPAPAPTHVDMPELVQKVEVKKEFVSIPPVPAAMPEMAEVEVPIAKEPQVLEEGSIKIPIHTPTPIPTRAPMPIVQPSVQEVGGLHYAEDDSPALPVVTRMPQKESVRLEQHVQLEQHRAQSYSRFPFVSLTIIALITLAGAAFASNFVSATIVSEPGKTATVQYAIHW